MSLSKHLDEKHLKGLTKLGDVMIPGDEKLPSFSKSGCIRGIDRIADYMPAQDLSDLKTLLAIFAVLPSFVVAFLLKVIEMSQNMPGPLGSILRFIRLGIRGLVMSLYYGDRGILDQIDYHVKVYAADVK